MLDFRLGGRGLGSLGCSGLGSLGLGGLGVWVCCSVA